MLAAVEDIDVVVLVHADAADFLERPAWGEFRPVLYRFVCVCAVANDSHAQAPPCSLRSGSLSRSKKFGQPGDGRRVQRHPTGPEPTYRNVRYSVGIGGKADMIRT